MYTLIKVTFFVIGLMPYWFLYGVSYVLHLFFFHVIKYRRKVVMDNISKCFPKKTTKEHLHIAKKFYLHLTDLMVETFKLGSVSNKTIKKRYRLTNPEMYTNDTFEGPSLVYMAHYGNYEYSCTVPLWTPKKISAVYQEVQNKSFNKYFINSRDQFGAHLVLNKRIYDYVKNHQNEATFIGMISDLTPHFGRIEYHNTFMGRKTPVHIGVENLAKKHNLPTYYMRVKKVKRGHYTSELIKIEADPNSTSPYPLTDKYFELLEQDVREQPACWFWSHRRWKYVQD